MELSASGSEYFYKTYRAVAAFLEYPYASLTSQWLCTGYYTFGAVDYTPPAWKGDEVWISSRVDSFGIKSWSHVAVGIGVG